MMILAATLLIHAQAGELRWQGYDWHVKSAVSEGPGPCRWSPKNVWIDSKGDLHMRIAQVDGQWCCSEIWTDQPLPFGEYQCQVKGPLDKLDPSVVFSMFSYQGPDQVKEIDIEYARWGNPSWPNGNWTVYPDNGKGKVRSKTFEFKLDGPYTTSRFTWSPTGVDYAFLGGYQSADSQKNLMQTWQYRPGDYANDVTQSPMPLHFNLWLFRNHPPADGKPVEIVVHRFEWIREK